MTNIDLNNLKTAIQKAKEQLISDIESIDFSINGVTQISDKPSIFTVKSGTIANNNFILSTEYYDVQAQKQRILGIVNNNNDIFKTLDTLKTIAEQKKFRDNTPIHPDILSSLNKYLNTIDI